MTSHPSVVVGNRRFARALKFLAQATSSLAVMAATYAALRGSDALLGLAPRPRNIAAVDATRSLTAAKHGERIPVGYVLRSTASRPIRIVGSRASCACTVVDDLPMVIGPGEDRVIPVTVTVPEFDSFNGSVELYTDDDLDPVIVLTFTGQVARGK